MANNKALAFIFDFDGVLIDSVSEVIQTVYEAITGQSLAKPPSEFASLFCANRWLVQPAGDLLVLGRWCLQQLATPNSRLSRQPWLTLLAAEPEPEPTRRATFFATRAAIINRDRQAWLNQHRTYSPLWPTLQALPSPQILILTNKNRAAVLELTSHFGLMVPAENIFSGDGGATKQQNLDKLLGLFPNAGQSTFIDDSIYNLLELQQHSRPPGLGLALATWGYLGPDDIQRAHQAKIPCLSCEEVARQVKMGR